MFMIAKYTGVQEKKHKEKNDDTGFTFSHILFFLRG